MAPVSLTPEEARVLGCLMEKSVTTPDNYPLSVNALVNACNQTTNREPIVEYSESTVERALDGLREKELTRRVKATGQRVIKHRHVVEEALGLDRPESTLLGVLLLRGAQTPGELKQRSERWHSFRSLDDVEDALGVSRRSDSRSGSSGGRARRKPAGCSSSRPPTTCPRRPPPSRRRCRSSRPSRLNRASREPAQPHSLEIRDPATGRVLRSVAITEAGEITQKVGRARAAQPAWAARPYADRAAVLRAFRDLLAAEAEECARITTSEVGKPIKQSRNEIRAVLDRIDWNVAHAGDVIGDRTVTSDAGLEERITYEPVGVVAHVSAWNYPYFVGLNSVVPALLAGNAVCYKPSEHATLTGLRLVDLLHRAGVPVDVVHAIVGGGPTGAALVDADVDLVCFTGSYATGREVARAAADRLVRVQLELGGKDAAYVCDDVDPEEAAFAVAEGAFYNGGQSCSATERVYVHEAVWESFVAALVEVVARVPGGRPGRRRHRRRAARPRRAAPVARGAARRRGRQGRQGAVRRRAHRAARQLVRADGGHRRSRHCRVDARRELRSGDRRGTRARRRRRDRADRRHRVRARRRGVLTRSGPRRADPRPARRRQRVLEHRRPLVRAAAVGRPPPLRAGYVDVGVGCARVRPREGLAPQEPSN